MLLVVTMGSEPTSGYAIIVDGVYEHGNQLEVVVRNVSPGRSCGTFQSMTAPVDIVELEKREGSVTFRDLDIATDCNQTRPYLSDGPSNKSLDRSGGSVVRIKLGAAKVERIRAARSTQTLGASRGVYL
jgi:hypothetical protein